jgi:sulfur carrier protein
MIITLNGKEREINPDTTVADLVKELNLMAPLAVELNQKVCPKRLHDHTIINQGDVLEIVTIVGGG